MKICFENDKYVHYRINFLTLCQYYVRFAPPNKTFANRFYYVVSGHPTYVHIVSITFINACLIVINAMSHGVETMLTKPPDLWSFALQNNRSIGTVQSKF